MGQYKRAEENDLKERIKQLENQLDFIGEQNKYIDKLENRIDKAISYIKENGCFNEEYKLCTKPFNTLKLDDLLDILKGDNK